MRRIDAVHAVLARATSGLATSGHGRWLVGPAASDDPVIEVVLDGEWLAVTAPLASACDEDELLRVDAQCPGAARAVVVPGGGIAIHADVALDAAVDLDRRVSEACADVRRTWRDVERGSRGDASARDVGAAHVAGAFAAHDDSSAAHTVDPGAAHDDMIARCRASGWPTTSRSAAEIAVDLDVRDAFHQALVTRDGDAIRACVAIGDGTPPAAQACRRAVALLLLRTAGAVRLVRAGRGRDDRVLFAVASTAPSSAELAHGFAALSVACRIAAVEAAALHHDPDLAETYLRAWNDAALRRAA